MGVRVNAGDALYAWFRQWSDFTNSPDLPPKELETFRTNPSERALNNIIATFNHNGGANPLFEQHAYKLWSEHRGKALGIRKANIPKVFYGANIEGQAYFKLITPAPADRKNVSYRGQLINSTIHFFKKRKPERTVVIFSQVNSETRRLVVPKLISKLFPSEKSPPYLYLRITPKIGGFRSVIPTYNTDHIPIEHIDFHLADVDAVAADSFIKDPPRNGTLLLDFLDYQEWLHLGDRRWLKPYHPLVDAIKSSFLKGKNTRLIFLLNSDPFTYKKVWGSFLPFLKALNLNQPNVVGVGINPQYMNEHQVANFLGINLTDARLIASRVPLLFTILLELKTFIESNPHISFEDVIKDIMGRVPPAKAIVVGGNKFNYASETEWALMKKAFYPLWGHSLFVLDVEKETIYPPPTRKISIDMPWDISNFRDVYERSAILKSMPDSFLVNEQVLVNELVKLQHLVSVEVKGDVASPAFKPYPLETLVQALTAGGRLTDDQGLFRRWAGHRDLYNRSRLLQSIVKADLKSPKKLIKKLLILRPKIIEEQREVLKVSEKKLPNYALATLVHALAAAGRIKGNIEVYRRPAGSHDLYERSPILQSIEDADLETPEKLIPKLIELRPSIIEEQRRVRKVSEKELKNYALTTLVQALIADKRIKGNVQPYERRATARDSYDRSPTIQNILPETLADSESLIRFLLNYRDRIAVENYKALDKLPPGAFTFKDASTHYSLTTLMGAVYMGGLIDKRTFDHLSSKFAAPLMHFMKRRDVVEIEIKKIKKGKLLFECIDESKFTKLKNPKKIVGQKYIRKIIKRAKWFLENEDNISLRSIYDAEELKAMVFEKHYDLFKDVPADFKWQIKNATIIEKNPTAARKKVVKALLDLTNYYDQLIKEGTVLKTSLEEGVKQIKQLVAWNKDALDFEDVGSDTGDGGLNGSGMPPVMPGGQGMPPLSGDAVSFKPALPNAGVQMNLAPRILTTVPKSVPIRMPPIIKPTIRPIISSKKTKQRVV